MNSYHSRIVMPGGIISINDVFYQVPADLEGQTIIVVPELLEYRVTSISSPFDPSPEIIPLQPGLLTAREINDRREAHEIPTGA